jgi:hypothetical protein
MIGHRHFGANDTAPFPYREERERESALRHSVDIFFPLAQVFAA